MRNPGFMRRIFPPNIERHRNEGFCDWIYPAGAAAGVTDWRILCTGGKPCPFRKGILWKPELEE